MLLDIETEAIFEVKNNQFPSPVYACFALLMAVRRSSIVVQHDMLFRLSTVNSRLIQVADVTCCTTMVSSLGLSYEESCGALELGFLGELLLLSTISSRQIASSHGIFLLSSNITDDNVVYPWIQVSGLKIRRRTAHLSMNSKVVIEGWSSETTNLGLEKFP